MKAFISLTSCLLILGSSIQSFGCGFCSGKPKGLSSGGSITQDPGSNSQNSGSTYGSNSNGTVGGPGSRSPFTSDLKNYKADGQRSSNEKWSSGDFFDNR